MVLSSTLTAALAIALASPTDHGSLAVAASGKVFFDLKLEGAPAGQMLPLEMHIPGPCKGCSCMRAWQVTPNQGSPTLHAGHVAGV